MPDMKLFFYLGFFVIGFVVIFNILKKSRLEEAFKKGETKYIVAAYFVICFIGAHLLAQFALTIISYFPLFDS